MLKRINKPKEFKRFKSKTLKGTIYHADALELLRSIKDESADLIFLDPPFNLGKVYGRSKKLDRRNDAEYEEWLMKILDEAYRILSVGGSLYLYHLPKWAVKFGAHLDKTLDFRHWIAVSMKGGFVRGNNLYPAHYSLLYYSKGKPKNFSRPRLAPQKCRVCGEYVKDYGGYRHIIEDKGINLSDVWDDISPVRHSHRKYRTQNELPAKLTDRVVEISGAKGGLYVDPFVGSGAGAISAVKKGMKFKVGDRLKNNCSIVHKRLLQLEIDPATEVPYG